MSSFQAAKQRGDSFCMSLWIRLCRSIPHLLHTAIKNESNIGAIFSFPPLFTNFQLRAETWKSMACLPSCLCCSTTAHTRRHVAIYLRGDTPVASPLPAPWNTYKGGNAINSGSNPSCWQAARDSRAVIASGQPQHRNYSHSPRTLPLSFCFLRVIANNITWIQIAGGETRAPNEAWNSLAWDLK